MNKIDRTPVVVGQLWVDCDKRMNGRTLRVIRIDGNRALCVVGATSYETSIRLDRFYPHSTGFRLIRNEHGERVSI